MNSQPSPEKSEARSSLSNDASSEVGEPGKPMNWRAWYFLVLVALAAELIGFTLITSYFA